jgi:hypothetical protein
MAQKQRKTNSSQQIITVDGALPNQDIPASIKLNLASCKTPFS